jgi:tetratricopeptide (TPR) repeat protein
VTKIASRYDSQLVFLELLQLIGRYPNKAAIHGRIALAGWYTRIFTEEFAAMSLATRNLTRFLRVLALIPQRECLCYLCLMSICFAGCRSICPRSMEKNVVDARQASLQGLDAMQQGKWDEAETIFASAVKCSPADERARGCYAETLWRRGACEQAITHMQEAVQLSQADPQRLVQLGEMHLSLGQLPEAAKCAEAATNKNCRLSTAWALRGDVHVARGQLDEALTAYHRSLVYNDHQPRVQLAMSHIYQQQARPQRALSTLETLAEQYPPGEIPANVFAAQGICLKQLDRPHDAVQMLAQAVRSGTPATEWLIHLAEAQMQAGDMSAALVSTQLAQDQDPNYPGVVQLKNSLESRQNGILTARLPSATLR